jgi:nucleotide-binding universal stress UspA family protein
VLGCYLVPDQTSPEHARDEFEQEAREVVDTLAERFRQAGAEVDSDLVFTPDMLQTVDRVAAESAIDAVVRTRPVEPVDSILVVVSEAINFDRLVRSIAVLGDGHTRQVRLIYADSTDAEADEKSLMLEGLEGKLEEAGLDAESLDSEFVLSDSPVDAILERTKDFDVVMVAERESSAADWVLKPIAEQILERAEIPVIVVRLKE